MSINSSHQLPEGDNGHQLLHDIFKLVDTNCKVITCSYVDNTDFSASVRTRFASDHTGSYASACDAWILQFSEVTKTNWIVFQTYPNLTKFEFRKRFLCQHAKKGKGKDSEKPRSRNLDCLASINIIVRKSTTHTRRIDRLMREGLNVAIKVSSKHTHPIHAVEAYSFLRMLPRIEAAFREYFDQGMSPVQAKSHHKTQLIASVGDTEETVSILADAQINPTDRQIYHLHETWRVKKFGRRDSSHEKSSDATETVAFRSEIVQLKNNFERITSIAEQNRNSYMIKKVVSLNEILNKVDSLTGLYDLCTSLNDPRRARVVRARSAAVTRRKSQPGLATCGIKRLRASTSENEETRKVKKEEIDIA